MSAPNYQNYSDKELIQALKSIDGAAYPQNHKNLLAEISRRQKNAPTTNQANTKSEAFSLDEALLDKAFVKDYWDPNKAQKQQKKVIKSVGYVMLLLFVGVFSLPAYFYSYLVDQQSIAQLNALAWGTAAIVFVLSVRHVRQTTHVNISDKMRGFFWVKSKQGEQKLATALKCFFVLILTLVTYYFAVRSLPVLIHQYVLDNSAQSIVVTVNKKRLNYHRKHCNGKVYIQEYQHAEVDYICSVLSRATWNKLDKGDKLRLFGTRSDFGFMVTGARKER